MIPDTLAIVFGAGGRLGKRLLPRLTAKSISVLGIARQNKPASWPHGMHWMQVDVTNPDEWPRSLGTLVGIARVHQHVVLVDLLLSRTTVTTMRDSIAAVTTYILHLRDRLAAADLSCSLVAASTTATLAPWIYQTPYGLAKRRQLVRYANSGITGAAFLLPSLVDTRANATGPWSVWTYEEAAEQLTSTTTTPANSTNRPAFRLIAPPASANSRTKDKRGHGEFMHVLIRSVPAHIGLLLHKHDSPRAHREASHHRLSLTPTWLRQQIDHHQIPPRMARRLAELLDTPIHTANQVAT